MSREPQFESIRALRGIAALCVAVSHLEPFLPASSQGMGSFPFAVGKAGVDVFFVISGFVMAIATSNLPNGWAASLGFLWRRLARIVPLYWIVTWALVVAILLDLNLGAQRSVDVEQLVRSLLFFPVHSPDGGIRPVIAVGWTLDYEMYFYLCMTIVIGLFARHRFLAIGTMMGVIYLIARATLDSRLDWVVNGGLACEFLLGFLAAICFRDLVRSGLLIAAALLICWIMLPDFRLLHPYGAGFDRALSWGMLSFVVVLGSACLERRMPIGPIPLLDRLGDASYSLYLIHVPAFALVRLILNWAGLELDAVTSAGILLLGAVCLAVILHRLIEKPLTTMLQKLRPFARLRRPLNRSFPN